MFIFGGISHIILLGWSIVTVLFFCFKRESILKNYWKVWVFLFIIGIIPELSDYVIYMRAGYLMRPVPLGMCHASFYLTSILMFKYNRKVHIVTFLLSAGAAIALIVPITISGEPLNILRPYSYYSVHTYLIVANIAMMHRYKLVLTDKDYRFGIGCVLAIATVFNFSTLISGADELFFYGGPEGLFTDKIEFGILRVIGSYFTYTLIYSIPYLIYKIRFSSRDYSSYSLQQSQKESQ